jgi:hypothetical protein
MNFNHDYLVLGQTVPEESKKYGLRVCTAGYSIKNDELIRVYPLGVKRKQHFKRWHIYNELPLRRNNKDNRNESWRLGIDVNQINDLLIVDGRKNKETILNKLYKNHSVTSIKEANDKRISLAIVKMYDCNGYFVDKNKKIINTKQYCLFDEDDNTNILGKNDYDKLPRIEWKDEEGYKHDFMFNSWDAYMHQINLSKKYGYDNLWKALKLNKDIPKLALIGNINSIRTSWLIISIF